MRGIDDVDAMEAAAGGTRIDVADAGKIEPRHELAIADAGAKQFGRGLEDLFARRNLDGADDWFDFGAEFYKIRSNLGLLGERASKRTDGAESTKETDTCRDVKEIAACMPVHDFGLRNGLSRRNAP